MPGQNAPDLIQEPPSIQIVMQGGMDKLQQIKFGQTGNGRDGLLHENQLKFADQPGSRETVEEIDPDGIFNKVGGELGNLKAEALLKADSPKDPAWLPELRLWSTEMRPSLTSRWDPK